MPSASVLEKNKAIVAELSEKVKNATAGVIVTYQGITVEDDTALRSALRKAGVDYKVYKNTFTGMALDNAGYSDIKGELAPAKILKEYADKIDSFTIKAGFVDGKSMTADEVLALAAVPSKQILVGKLLGGMRSPLNKLAMVLQAIIDKEPAAETAEAAAEASAAE